MIEEKSCESSDVSSEQETAQKAKDVEDYFNYELCSRKKDENKNDWNIKKHACTKRNSKVRHKER